MASTQGGTMPPSSSTRASRFLGTCFSHYPLRGIRSENDTRLRVTTPGASRYIGFALTRHVKAPTHTIGSDVGRT
ncbi:hypothetical protein MTO96_023691 [Rhipicephalus appendiculatus]